MHHCSLKDIDGMSGKITRRPEKLTGYRIWEKLLGYGIQCIFYVWDTGETYGMQEKLMEYWRNLWDTGELDMILEKLT